MDFERFEQRRKDADANVRRSMRLLGGFRCCPPNVRSVSGGNLTRVIVSQEDSMLGMTPVDSSQTHHTYDVRNISNAMTDIIIA